MNLQLRFRRIVCSILLAAVTLTIPALAQQDSNKSTSQPPLIDRELFFGNPEIAGAQISPDGKFIAFLKPYKDTRNIWVKRVEEPFSAAKLVTSDTKRPIPGYFWSRDGKYILFVKDKDGDEDFNVYAVNPAEAPAAGDGDRRPGLLLSLERHSECDRRCGRGGARGDCGPTRSPCRAPGPGGAVTPCFRS